jgi:hypothetical protein
MKLDDIRALYDKEQRLEVEYGSARREIAGPVVRLIGLQERRSCVIHSRLEDGDVTSVIHEQVTYFESLGHDFEWKVYSHDPPPDLPQQLQARGFEAEETEAIMVLDLHQMPGELASPVPHEVRRIATREELSDVIAVHSAITRDDGFELEDRLARELDERPEQTGIYVAYVDREPASAAWINLDPRTQFASMWGGSTVSQHRRRGLYTSLVAVRAQEARQRGFRYLTADARNTSRPILERLGLKVMTFATAMHWRASFPGAARG